MDFYICDDAEPQLTEIARQTAALRLCAPQQIHTFTHADALLKALESAGTCSIILLDISLAGDQTGIRVARTINSRYPAFPIIFITAYLQYAADIGEAAFIYFLTKPVKISCLARAVHKAAEALTHRHFILYNRGVKHCILKAEIMWIERIKRTSQVHTKSELFCVSETLEDLLKRLLSPHFVQCHKSYAVNLNYIKAFKPHTILLTDHTVVPVSRKFLNQVNRAMALYFGLTE